MEEKDFLKAMKLNKEELIEWLNEQYKQEKRLKEIIEQYEEKCGAIKTRETKHITNSKGEEEIFIEEIVSVNIDGDIFKYYTITF